MALCFCFILNGVMSKNLHLVQKHLQMKAFAMDELRVAEFLVFSGRLITISTTFLFDAYFKTFVSKTLFLDLHEKTRV